MAGRFEATVVIDRPIEEVFAFLADGENDPKFSPRVLEIAKTTDGPPGVGTVYASTVKDAGMKTKHGPGKLIALRAAWPRFGLRRPGCAMTAS
jgi:hypothetical protein